MKSDFLNGPSDKVKLKSWKVTLGKQADIKNGLDF